MRVGDKIYAHCGAIRLNGVIVCGFSDRAHDFTGKWGTLIDPSETIAIKLDDKDAERVRIRPERWDFECVDPVAA